MFHDFKYVVSGAILFLLVGSISGWAVGEFAGNYFTGIHFAGVQGKEATGYLGFIIIGTTGALMGANLGKLYARKQRQKSDKLHDQAENSNGLDNLP